MTDADNRILGYGVAGSLAMHVLLFCALALSMGMGRVNQIPRTMPEPEPVVTMVFPEDIKEMPPEEIPKPKTEPQRYIRTTQNEDAINAPTKTDFVSDRNTVASAKLAPDPAGVAGMPTLNGVNIPTTELVNREFKDGEIKNDSALPAPPPQKIVSETKEHLPLEIRRAGDPPEQAPEMKTPDEPPLPTALAMASPSAKDTFAPQTRTSAAKGTLSNLGAENAVNATATATGRYTRQVTAAIEEKWNRCLKQKNFLVDPGKLRLFFYVDKNGRINPDELSIVFNEATAELMDIARKSILEADIPKIPEELLLTLDQGRFGIEYDAVLLEAKNAQAGQ